MYRQPKNNPMIGNQEKKIFAKRMADRPTGPPLPLPMVDLQVRMPPKPKPPPKPTQYTYPSYFPGPDPMNPVQFASYMQQVYNPPTVIKNYNLDVGGLRGDHIKASALYADVLPSSLNNQTYNSLGERIATYEFMRNILFPKGDGNDINIDADGHDNILSHMKFMDLNPFSTSRLSKNPYKTLPKGFFLYTSCYPIDFGTGPDRDALCAKNSTGVNVRVYQMTEGAFMLEKLKGSGKFKDYDVWRDVAFYEYIRDNILKKKICPNFPLIYGYHMPHKSGINFRDIGNIKDIQKDYSSDPRLQARGEAINYEGSVVTDVNAYTGKVLISMTEAPNHSLFGWSSVVYSSEGNTHRMINAGYHNSKVWMSVLFQIMAAMAVMQEHAFSIENFSLEKNVFIKDLKKSGDVNSYWKYIIDGIEYFIPNHGYLVLIDSNYRDKLAATENAPSSILESGPPSSSGDAVVDLLSGLTYAAHTASKLQTQKPLDLSAQEGKIKGKFLGDDPAEVRKHVYEMFKKNINPNVFTQEYTENGGMTLPENVRKLMAAISTDNSSENISDYIVKYMTVFMNNRIGTYLKDTEKENVRDNAGTDFKKGEIAVYTADYGAEVFCTYLEESTAGKSYVLSRGDPASHIDRIELPAERLKKYLLADPIEQKFRANEANFSNDPLETYTIRV